MLDFHSDYVYLLDGISPNDRFQGFGETKISSRYEALLIKLRAFIKQIDLCDYIYVDKNLLWQSVLDYFADIARLKKFHGIKRANEDKMWPYTGYWIIRRKPLQIKSDTKNIENYMQLKNELNFINEKFVLCFILKYLTYPKRVKTDCEVHLKNKIDIFIENLFYYFKYRKCDPQSIELTMYSFKAGLVLDISNNKKGEITDRDLN